VAILPFLIAGFLLINPIVEWGFRRFDIQTEKLQFWVMVTSGTAWSIALVYFLLSPTSTSSEAQLGDNGLLPRLEFSHDWISAALILIAVGLIFAAVLKQQERPVSNAWLAGLGGACVIGLETNSAYSLGLIWTMVEGLLFYSSYRNQKFTSTPQQFLPIVLLRLSAPASLILYSLTLNEPNISVFSAGAGTGAGLILISAGLLGFWGWFLLPPDKANNQDGSFPGTSENWIPAMLGVLIILRGGILLDPGSVQLYIPLILAIALVLTVLLGLVLGQSPRLWFLCCSLLISVSAIISGVENALSLGMAMILPGLQLWWISKQPKIPLLPLIFGILGLLPVPFLPSWTGVSTFSAGLPGILVGVSYGMLLGSILIALLKNWQSSADTFSTHPLLGIIGAAAILLSQAVVSLRLDLIDSSRDIFGRSVLIWISFLGFIPILILGNQLPLKKTRRFVDIGSRFRDGVEKFLTTSFHFLDRLVEFISQIFEGQGGLIWTLLIGLLLISLIRLRGG
jgi:hypothetical protein